MDYGEAKFIRTKRLKQQLLIFNSCRRVGYAFQFMKKKDGVYECCECKKLGKSRSVPVSDGRIIAKKDPEDDHHDDCQPVLSSVIDAMEIDRDMRHTVKKLGNDLVMPMPMH